MKKLMEKLGQFIGVEPLMEGKEYDQAKNFLSKGILPNGDKSTGGKPAIKAGFDGDINIKRLKKKDTKSGTIFKFDLELKPGKGGGAGATIDAASSNHYFNIAGTDSKNVKAMKDAFGTSVKGATKTLGQQLHKWFGDPDNWVWRVVGWSERKSWTKPNVKIAGIRTSGTMIDPTRRKWPSGRTEVWVPLTVTVQAEMKRK